MPRRETVSEALLDRIAIVELVSRYCRGIDRRDFALVRSLYHDDAIENHGTMFSGTADEFIAWLPEVMAPWDATIHTIGNSVVAVDGVRAEAEHQVRAWHRTHGPDRKEYIVHGRYLDRYERRDGIWKFLERSLVFDHGEVRDVDEAAIEQLGGDAPHGRADRGDPSWDLPLLAVLG
jgi:hypothetical protein